MLATKTKNSAYDQKASTELQTNLLKAGTWGIMTDQYSRFEDDHNWGLNLSLEDTLLTYRLNMSDLEKQPVGVGEVTIGRWAKITADKATR